MKYDVTAGQLEHVIKPVLEYYDDGDEIHVFNKRTGRTDIYVVETKKVLTKKPHWNEKQRTT